LGLATGVAKVEEVSSLKNRRCFAKGKRFFPGPWKKISPYRHHLTGAV
jgi:hypothetical protein